ncbi:hypothetical protein [uncultured Microscilla sp.]|uniref:hypothetical protein n=1 Tax=uncultured Microscilla sp. TaxID=432653 RepID=UPI0026271546|nr:hypothetical protein [uncultured Microscilla sp.]
MYHHKASNAKIFYDHLGIHISFLGSTLVITWDEIAFCSITPALEKVNGEWHPLKHLKLDGLPFLHLDFKLKNLYVVKQRCNIIMRMWYLLQVNFKSMLDQQHQPINDEGILMLECDLKSFNIPVNEVIDLLQENTKPGVFVHFT